MRVLWLDDGLAVGILVDRMESCWRCFHAPDDVQLVGRFAQGVICIARR